MTGVNFDSFLEASELHNLSLIVNFFNDHKALVKDRLKQLEDVSKESQNSLDDQNEAFYQRHDYTGCYSEFMRNNLFVMLYSHLEEFLANQSMMMTRKVPGRRTFEDFKDNLKKYSGIQIGDHCDWQFISDCSNARHIILHRRGNTNLATNPDVISQICNRNAGCFDVINSRLVVTDSCNARFSSEIQTVLKLVIAHLRSVQS